MFELFIQGGWQFMSLISILALAMLFFSFKAGTAILHSTASPKAGPPPSLYYVRFFGMLALVVGILGQIIGLYEAMKHIASTGGIPQEVLTGGIRISSITTLYGFSVFLLAHLIWFGLDLKYRSRVKA